MYEISSKTLADLLNDGFEGDVQFGGRVFCIINGLFSGEQSIFYESSGRFILSPPILDRRWYSLRQENYSLRFERRKNTEIRYSNNEVYGPKIVVPITIHDNASLQIEPRGKILF